MIPALASRYQSAITVMQNITAFSARNAREEDGRMQLPGQPSVVSSAKPRDMQAINDYYFGNHLTVTEVMTRMMERVVGHLNEKLALGRDDSPEGVKAGNEWRGKALLDRNNTVGSESDFSIPLPGEDGVTFREVARMIQSKFNIDFLSQSKEIRHVLEEVAGFEIDGMNVGDLFEAFVEPAGKAAGKVRDVISEGLAGQAGSKTSERLEDAAQGPKSVEETLASIKSDDIAEVDEETLAEDYKKIEDARNRGKIEKVVETQERIAEIVEKSRESDEPLGAATELALTVIGHLAPKAEALEETAPSKAAEEGEAAAEAAAAPQDGVDRASGVRGRAAGEERDPLRELLEKAYRETMLGEDDSQHPLLML